MIGHEHRNLLVKPEILYSSPTRSALSWPTAKSGTLQPSAVDTFPLTQQRLLYRLEFSFATHAQLLLIEDRFGLRHHIVYYLRGRLNASNQI